jgi:hypothetical protein
VTAFKITSYMVVVGAIVSEPVTVGVAVGESETEVEGSPVVDELVSVGDLVVVGAIVGEPVL